MPGDPDMVEEPVDGTKLARAHVALPAEGRLLSDDSGRHRVRARRVNS